MAAEHVRLYGLEVFDDAAYVEYRRHMAPFLARHGGSFEYDFVVARVLKQPTPGAINRVFTVAFPGGPAAEHFFADPDYLAVRARHLEGAVRGVREIAAYDRDAEAPGRAGS